MIFLFKFLYVIISTLILQQEHVGRSRFMTEGVIGLVKVLAVPIDLNNYENEYRAQTLGLRVSRPRLFSWKRNVLITGGSTKFKKISRPSWVKRIGRSSNWRRSLGVPRKLPKVWLIE